MTIWKYPNPSCSDLVSQSAGVSGRIMSRQTTFRISSRLGSRLTRSQ